MKNEDRERLTAHLEGIRAHATAALAILDRDAQAETEDDSGGTGGPPKPPEPGG